MNSLSKKSCIPCKGGVDPMPLDERSVLLKSLHKDWELQSESNRLFRSYKFSDYKRAWDLANQISVLAEEQFHHPEISFGWGHLEVTLWTHKIGSLVESDFILAAKIDLLTV
ncbi:hypothetical protein A9Q84_01335 [Halobacteriovorax marinus]|uniref:4a-hydroxytetrahydrobiopterin dehydratase n=1 Tax=Halobacteriovorax marinus TaxID=97084 RepID=A0A1Y5FG16_9BACT|nr:hypothetical protein A9Q84_01335 [Halobacteriovorax marinus]